MGAFTYGWADDSKDPHHFWLRFDRTEREPISWKEELYAAARSIASRANKPIWVCSSGGIDSEVACRAFLDQKIPFAVLTLEHSAGTNQYDTSYATAWCKANGISQKIVAIDMHRFLKDDIEAYAQRYTAIHPFRYLQLRLMETVDELGGFAVLGSGEQIYTADAKRQTLSVADLYLPLSNGTAMPLEWCKDRGTQHEPYFHFATPELCLSYMRIPVIDFALRNPDPLFRHPSNTYTLKRLAYQSIWPDMPVRFKAHGFDKIHDIYEAAKTRLRDRFAASFAAVHLPVVEFERQLTSDARLSV